MYTAGVNDVAKMSLLVFRIKVYIQEKVTFLELLFIKIAITIVPTSESARSEL
jgi:hypothetical protein